VSIAVTEIEKIARLARLRLEESQIEPLTERLNNILAMVDALQAVDTSGVEPMANPLDAVQRLRPDSVTEADQRDRFLAIAPQSEQGLYLVPQVIE
jgi:aspartyl-tRNA(Asn)/glutamyl-tRNA(Gln) amidotransferase subunit C